MPPAPPPFYSPGEPSEAMIYTGDSRSAWRSTPGALDWLRKAVKPAKKKAPMPSEPATQGPTAHSKAGLLRLPSRFEVWQADARALDSLIASDSGLIQPWMLMVINPNRGVILAQAISDQPPSSAVMWDVLARAMASPSVGKPHRPTQLQVRPGAIWDDLQPHFDEIGVRCAVEAELGTIDEIYAELSSHLSGKQPPGLLEMPGVTPEQVGGFYRAAAGFYRQSPWKRLGAEQGIKIECDRYQSGPWYAVVMGQMGMTLGLTLYEDLDLLRKTWAGKMSDRENARRTVALTVTFDQELDVPTADLLAGRRYGWEVASPDAYPIPFRKELGMSMRPPLEWELELLEGCLVAITAFIAIQKPDDLSCRSIAVPVQSGELTMIFSWLGD